MAVEITTGRGLYRLVSAAQSEDQPDAIVLTLALERADGIERVAFRCRISRGLLDPGPGANLDTLIAGIAPWMTREFEATREAALKSIRSERKLYEITIDDANRGPF
jgi:hypothetical protein